MININDNNIKNMAAHEMAYALGCSIADNVRNLEYIKHDDCISAIIEDDFNYYAIVKMNKDGKVQSFACQCSEFYNYDGACRHIVALLKKAQEKYSGDSFKNNKDVFIPFTFNKASSKHIKAQLWLEHEFTSMGYDKVALELKLKAGETKPYVVKNIKSFLEALEENRFYHFTKKYEIDFRNTFFDGTDKKVLDLLTDILRKEKVMDDYLSYRSYYRENNSIFFGNTVKLFEDNLKAYLEIVKNSEKPLIYSGSFNQNLKIEDDLEVKIKVEEKNGDLLMNANYDDNIKIMALTQNFEYAFDPYKLVVYRIPEEKKQLLDKIHSTRTEKKNPTYRIRKEDRVHFLKEFIPSVKESCHVEIDPELAQKVIEQELQCKIYFDITGKGISAKVRFTYGDKTLKPGISENTSELILRDHEKEKKIISLLNSCGMYQKGDLFYSETEDDIAELISGKIDMLKEAAELFYSDAFKALKIKNVNSVQMGIRLNTNSNLLEFDFNVDDFGDDEILNLLDSVREKKKYYRLKDGSILKLDNKQLIDLSMLFSDLDINEKKIKGSKINLPSNKALFLDNYLDEKEFKLVSKNADYEKLVSEILNPKDLNIKLTSDLEGVLRDYQKFGYKWLKTLSHYGFGGILADDMGLGKTLQVLSFIKSEKAEDTTPCLVVAPTSLVFNWKAEVEKFVPDLSAAVISGTKTERESLIKEIQNYDLAITSYGSLKRDIEQYENINFSYVFVDEAQHIKNPATLNAGSVKSLRAKGCFALTGTPIENTLTELWSVFDFIMPGYLMSHHKFIKKFESPIVKNDDKEALKRLSQFIKPFVLRRLKKDVLKELPDKIESKTIAEMTVDQKKLYAAYLKKAQGEVASEIKTNGIEKSKIKILAILTRLRQLCCHPATFIDNYKGGSGKLDTLMELVENSIESGHRMLIFSQFTSMLQIIGAELNKLKIPYFYLDGSTKAEDRLKMVNSYNSLEKPVFLISLKAGGTGLNLTAADIVIHFDPWWNPSVEDQATDRAYRIGQTKVVQVFKIVAKGTIEERILELQEKKKDLINNVIHAGENLVTQLSETEIRNLFQMNI
ncbi:DEAD/DEAH box helicase [Pseudobacteroides cellulosolvens]|uniref:SNF2 helicase associated domain protein n=2 Tax=Pseudobacteroides cellulosolvens TaxID=35825 RepID=A0A0L6JV35_9FIRM|nr:DEAD/DEAH box helicase [Pseudobacteroides cellulosolvens]KNY29282.1 SNF2 helicase associated domain protein [Pseudobacteroides cellulosolvens ATCC 35603 = DSM 2933]